MGSTKSRTNTHVTGNRRTSKALWVIKRGQKAQQNIKKIPNKQKKGKNVSNKGRPWGSKNELFSYFFPCSVLSKKFMRLNPTLFWGDGVTNVIRILKHAKVYVFLFYI